MDTLLKRFSFYPIIISLLPIFSLVLANMGKVSITPQLGVLSIPLAGILIVWMATKYFIKDHHKADLITTVIGFMFFTFGYLQKIASIILITIYGQTFDVIERFGRMNDHPEILRLIFIGWLLFVAVAVFLFIKANVNLEPVSLFFNYASLAIVVFSMFNWLYTAYLEEKSTDFISDWQRYVQKMSFPKFRCPENPPDIYYIIPDAYARADVLQRIYHVDNSKFLGFLSDQGFAIIQHSQSNYSQTPLSLASSLNFMYLDDVISKVGELSKNRAPLQEMLLQSKIATLLSLCGYKFVAFSSGFAPTEMYEADIYLVPEHSLTDFQNELINLTPLPAVSIVFSLINQYQLHRDRILYTLDKLPQLGSTFSDPIFVFAHIPAPHHPFVFDQNGSPVDSGRIFALSEDMRGEGVQEYIRGYVEQLVYINSRLKEIIPRIIAQRPETTIIILQSDHGPSSQLNWDSPNEIGVYERMSILNAYYLGGQNPEVLPDTITPVNSFRLILNIYFNADLPLLEDRSYFSTLNLPYKMSPVPLSSMP